MMQSWVKKFTAPNDWQFFFIMLGAVEFLALQDCYHNVQAPTAVWTAVGLNITSLIMSSLLRLLSAHSRISFFSNMGRYNLMSGAHDNISFSHIIGATSLLLSLHVVAPMCEKQGNVLTMEGATWAFPLLWPRLAPHGLGHVLARKW